MISLLGQSGYPGPRGESGVSIVPHSGEQNREEFVMKHQLRRCQTGPGLPVKSETIIFHQLNKQWFPQCEPTGCSVASSLGSVLDLDTLKNHFWRVFPPLWRLDTVAMLHASSKWGMRLMHLWFSTLSEVILQWLLQENVFSGVSDAKKKKKNFSTFSLQFSQLYERIIAGDSLCFFGTPM